MLYKTRALRAGGIGPVVIRACVDFRWVRVGPVVCNTGRLLGSGVAVTSGTGGEEAAASVSGRRV